MKKPNYEAMKKKELLAEVESFSKALGYEQKNNKKLLTELDEKNSAIETLSAELDNALVLKHTYHQETETLRDEIKDDEQIIFNLIISNAIIFILFVIAIIFFIFWR